MRSTRSTRLLCALLLLIAGLAQADEAADLRAEFGAAYQAADWPRALRAGERLVALTPDNSAMHYNMACALALSGDAERAAASLIRAGETGFSYITTFRTDPDLASVRELPAHARALELVLANHEREFAEFRERADATDPLLFVPQGLKRPAPLVIVLHGRGGQAWPLFEAWKPTAKRAGAVLIAPQSLDRFGEGFHWLKVDEAEYLVLLAIRQAQARQEIDLDRVVVTGFSQGGYVAFVMGARHPERFAGVIPIGAYTDAAVAIPESDGRLPRYQVIVGDQDEVLEGCRASAQALSEAGLTVRLREIAGLGHDLPQQHELRRALRFVLK
jgi:predicted esterase